ncbi:MAG: hypothetical protein AAGE43_02785 [Pseudomonadota bacterium]
MAGSIFSQDGSAFPSGFKGMPRAASRQLILGLALLLGACASEPLGGPTAPRGAEGAGELTLASSRSYWVYPEDLAYTGSASYRWPDERTFSGDFKAGQPNGMGLGTWPNGDRYRGTWRDGVQHGHGELTRSDGSRYLGDFILGVRQGEGVEQSGEGLYRGQWLGDLPNGTGEFHGTDGAAYRGQWRDGVRQGEGDYTDPQGNHYQGSWYVDQPDGFGVLRNADGSGYEGEWRSGTQHGYGRSQSTSGTNYEGTWTEGKRQGFGIAERLDGSRYEGEWLSGQREGQGRESFADGSYHDGVWANDQPLGPGTRGDRTGIEITGVWTGNSVRTGLMVLPSGAQYAGKLLKEQNTEVEPALLTWLEAQAKAGDPFAHFFLGTAYADFKRPEPDEFKATRHFRAAARGGVADGQFRLALNLLENTPEQALSWLESAAGARQTQANTLLGEYYLTGNLVPADPARAIGYLEVASAAGDMAARNNLAWVLATTDREELRDADRALALIRPLAVLEDHWHHLDTLAAAHAALEDYEQARAVLVRAISAAALELGEDSAEVSEMRDRLRGMEAIGAGQGGS